MGESVGTNLFGEFYMKMKTFIRHIVAENGSVLIYGTCGPAQSGIHEFLVYMETGTVTASIVERGSEVARPLVMSLRELGEVISSPELDGSHVVDVWREVCASYPHH